MGQIRKNTIFAGYNRLFREGMNLLLGERFDINHVESFEDALKAMQTGELTIDLLIGDPSKARKKLGWTPKTSFADLVSQMVAGDLAIARHEVANGKHPV